MCNTNDLNTDSLVAKDRMSTRLITFFTVVNLVCYLDRYIVASVLPLLIDEFQLSNQEAGSLISAFVVGYFLFAPIFGYLGDRISRPWLMGVAVFLWSLATAFSGLVASYGAFIAARIGVGIGEAGFASIAPGYFKDRIQDPVRVNSALAIFFAAIPIGSALGYLLGGMIVKYFSWHMVFFIGAAPGFLLAFFFLPLKEIRQVSTSSLNLQDGLKQILKTRILMFAIGGYVLTNFTLTAVAAFAAVYGVSLGFSLQSINLAFGLAIASAGAIGTLAGGRLASRLANRSDNPVSTLLAFSGISALLAVPLFIGAFVVSSHSLFIALVFLAALFIFAGIAPVNSVIVLSCPADYVTLTQGIAIFFLNLVGALLSPVIVGAIADASSLRFALSLTSISVLAGALCWLIGVRPRNRV